MYKSTANIVIAKSMVCLIDIYLGRCPEKKQLLFRALPELPSSLLPPIRATFFRRRNSRFGSQLTIKNILTPVTLVTRMTFSTLESLFQKLFSATFLHEISQITMRMP